MSTRTVEEALKEVLQDDGRISKYEARVIREMVMADGKVSLEEKRALQQALESDALDEEAFEMFSQVLLRAGLK